MSQYSDYALRERRHRYALYVDGDFKSETRDIHHAIHVMNLLVLDGAADVHLLVLTDNQHTPLTYGERHDQEPV